MDNVKRAKVIMLPTEDRLSKSNLDFKDICLKDDKLYLGNSYELYQKRGAHKNSFGSQNQHIYIISDDEIKEGDYKIIYSTLSGDVLDIKQHQKDEQTPSNQKKIIATTDTSLSPQVWIKSIGYLSLPQPSQQFIEKYIEAYNKGEIITDVLIEYDWVSLNFEFFWKLKVNPKDNTIIIKKLKDSWNREEIINKLKKFNCSVEIDMRENEFNKWIEENL